MASPLRSPPVLETDTTLPVASNNTEVILAAVNRYTARASEDRVQRQHHRPASTTSSMKRGFSKAAGQPLFRPPAPPEVVPIDKHSSQWACRLELKKLDPNYSHSKHRVKPKGSKRAVREAQTQAVYEEMCRDLERENVDAQYKAKMQWYADCRIEQLNGYVRSVAEKKRAGMYEASAKRAEEILNKTLSTMEKNTRDARYCEQVQAEHQQWVDVQVQKAKSITLSNSPRNTLKVQSDHEVPPVGSYRIPDMIGRAQKQPLSVHPSSPAASFGFGSRIGQLNGDNTC